MSAPNVKFPRQIREGMQGKDVKAHKRAISRARPDFYAWHDFTDYAGGKFLDAVVKWKKSRGMNNQRMIGRTAHEVLERTHAKGKPDEWAFDKAAVKLAYEYWEASQVPPEDKIRKAICDAGFFWYSHRGEIAYSQARPFQAGKPLWIPSRWDCSAYVTNCHFAGGAPDPNGRGYDHYGYTGTLMDNGVRVGSITQLKPGDLIFYGRTPSSKPGFPAGSPTHVALFVGNGMVLSNGSHPMGYYRWNYRTVNHLRH